MSPGLAGEDGAPSARPAASATAPRPAGPAPQPRTRLQAVRAAAARWAPVLGPAAAMTVAALWGLTRDSSMGNDEVATRWAALLSVADLARLLRHVDAVHGLYYLLMHAWVVIGSSPTALRVPSVIAMIIATALVATLARRLTGSGWAALFAGLVMALTPTITYYAQTARSYAMVLACVTASTLALVHALQAEASGDQRRARRWWIGYAALILVSGYLNEMALLVLAAHAVTVLVARYGRQVIRHWLYAAVPAAVLVLPLLALSVTEHAAIGWIARPGLPALKTLFHDYFGTTTIVGVLVLACAVVALLPDRSPGQAAASWWRGGVSLPSVAAPLLVIPAVLLLAESRVLHPLYVDRYVLYGEAGAALLAGAGAYRIGRWAAGRLARPGAWRALAVLPGVVLCVLALVLQLGPDHRIRTPGSRAYDFGGPSRYVGAHARDGDGVLYMDTFFRKAELGYPWDFTKVTDFGEAVTPRQAGDFRGVDKSFAQTLPLMLSYQRIWVIGAKPSARLPADLLRSESETLQQRFTLARIQHFRGITVTLWVRR